MPLQHHDLLTLSLQSPYYNTYLKSLSPYSVSNLASSTPPFLPYSRSNRITSLLSQLVLYPSSADGFNSFLKLSFFTSKILWLSRRNLTSMHFFLPVIFLPCEVQKGISHLCYLSILLVFRLHPKSTPCFLSISHIKHSTSHSQIHPLVPLTFLIPFHFKTTKEAVSLAHLSSFVLPPLTHIHTSTLNFNCSLLDLIISLYTRV